SSGIIIRVSQVRVLPPLLEHPLSSHPNREKNGNRSTSRDHARLQRLQAAQLSVAEVQAQLPRPRGVPQVLPLVRAPHAAPGDPLAMARETRRQRRAARAAAGDGAQTSRRSRAAQVRPSQQPVKQQTGRKSDKQRGQFIRESYAELKKVDWPTRRQTFQGVVVVLIACTIVGVYLWGLDQVIRPLVDKVLL